MKSKLLLFVLLCCGLYAHGQSPAQKLIRFGLKAGINGSLFTRNTAPFDNPNRRQMAYFNRFFRPSGFGGVTIDFQVSPRLYIGTEVLYNTRGMVYREKNDAVYIVDDEGNEQQAYNNFNYNIDYFELPVTLNYNVSRKGSNTLLTVYGGIAPGIVSNAKTKLYYEESTTSDGRFAGNRRAKLNNVRELNNNLIAGLKVGEDAPDRIAFFGDFRVSHTLQPVFSRDTDDYGNNLNTNMLTFSIAIGLRF